MLSSAIIVFPPKTLSPSLAIILMFEGTIISTLLPKRINPILDPLLNSMFFSAEKNIEFKRGSRMGFIRFGSRVDMIVPSNIKIIAKEGDRVLGGKTIIAELST